MIGEEGFSALKEKIKTMERERDTVRRQLKEDEAEIEHWRTRMLTISHELDQLETGIVQKEASLREYDAIIGEGEKAFEKIVKNASLLSRAVDMEAEEIHEKWRFGKK